MNSKFRMIPHVKAAIRNPVAYIRSILRMPSGSDVTRWSNPQNLKPDWDERTQIMASYVPEGAQVIEFGAARLTLPNYLPPHCTYQPVDLVPRSSETLSFDLNGVLPSLPKRYSHAVFSGVLEYVEDIERLVCWLQGWVDHVIFSYATADRLSDPITRSANGWVNSYTEAEIAQLFRDQGVCCIRVREWKEQNIYIVDFTDSRVSDSFQEIR